VESSKTPTDWGWPQAVEQLLILGAIALWLVAALLIRLVTPDVLADASPFAAPSMAAGAVRVAGAAAAAVGLFVLAGTVAAVFTQASNAPARVLLVLAGGVGVLAGLVLLSGGAAFLAHGPAMRAAAIIMIAGAVVEVAVGGLACAAGATRLLPGMSLVERMAAKSSARPPGRLSG
jgi:hypothetical protein